jgi:hypothetical protein
MLNASDSFARTRSLCYANSEIGSTMNTSTLESINCGSVVVGGSSGSGGVFSGSFSSPANTIVHLRQMAAECASFALPVLPLGRILVDARPCPPSSNQYAPPWGSLPILRAQISRASAMLLPPALCDFASLHTVSKNTINNSTSFSSSSSVNNSSLGSNAYGSGNGFGVCGGNIALEITNCSLGDVSVCLAVSRLSAIYASAIYSDLDIIFAAIHGYENVRDSTRTFLTFVYRRMAANTLALACILPSLPLHTPLIINCANLLEATLPLVFNTALENLARTGNKILEPMHILHQKQLHKQQFSSITVAEKHCSVWNEQKLRDPPRLTKGQALRRILAMAQPTQFLAAKNSDETSINSGSTPSQQPSPASPTQINNISIRVMKSKFKPQTRFSGFGDASESVASSTAKVTAAAATAAASNSLYRLLALFSGSVESIVAEFDSFMNTVAFSGSLEFVASNIGFPMPRHMCMIMQIPLPLNGIIKKGPHTATLTQLRCFFPTPSAKTLSELHENAKIKFYRDCNTLNQSRSSMFIVSPESSSYIDRVCTFALLRVVPYAQSSKSARVKAENFILWRRVWVELHLPTGGIDIWNCSGSASPFSSFSSFQSVHQKRYSKGKYFFVRDKVTEIVIESIHKKFILITFLLNEDGSQLFGLTIFVTKKLN